MSAMPMRRIDAPRRRPSREGRSRSHVGRHASPAGRGFGRSPRRRLQRRDGHPGMAEASAIIEQRPMLEVVPRRRLAANAAAVVVVMVGVLMLSAVVLHTRLAERQVQIDRLERQVSNSRQLFDVLRQQRAELRAPTRLAAESARLGMSAAPQTQFMAVDPDTLAQILASTGTVNSFDGLLIESDPLDQVRRVRAADTDGDGS